MQRICGELQLEVKNKRVDEGTLALPSKARVAN
jgi:hypothetical protein